nr:RNA-directed DNA polymerase, eukaryota, reverse transcriptase zinc-binding domain protein [Tanacetum cinerariifolium]
MEALHLSFTRAVDADIFTCYKIDSSTTLSHLFYADDVIFIGDWSSSNLRGIMNILRCFSLLSGMSINIHKSHILGVGIPEVNVAKAAKSIGNFFNGVQEGDRRIAWVKWARVLAANKFKGLGVSNFFALNRVLMFKWVWRYLSRDNSLWYRSISALHGLNGQSLSAAFRSPWSTIMKEVSSLKDKDCWFGDKQLKVAFPRLYALEECKDISVVDKLHLSLSHTFCRPVRGGEEAHQLDLLSVALESVTLSNIDDRWVWDLNGDGLFQVKGVRALLDEAFLLKTDSPTRWIKCVPIKACPLCGYNLEEASHLFFRCSMAKDIQYLVCRWWNLDIHPYDSYDGWLSWFKSIRLGPKLKDVLEGVFYVSWWSIWYFRNQLLFSDSVPRKEAIIDNIILRSFNWCIARNYSSLNCVSWLQHPYLTPV